MSPFERNWKELKRPSYLDRNLISAENWLDAKRNDDDLVGLWRVHGKLYDLRGFVNKHPGGAQWLVISQGTDITEGFESHHLTGKAEAILSKYFVKEATTQRNSPFTFHEDGFYKTLKREVYKKLKTLPCEKLKLQSNIIIDLVVVTSLSIAMLASYWHSYKTAALAGVLLSFGCVASHNFLHQKDNWRMYYLNLSLMSVRDWRITHVLSHHQYVNTLQDFELTSHEPVFNFKPDPAKCWIARYVSWVYYPFAWATTYHAEFIARFISGVFFKTDMIPLVIPALLLLANGGQILSAMFIWTWLLLISCLAFNLNDVIASHRHPKCFVEGDAPRENRDWGINQIDATLENRRFIGSRFALIFFGDHTLHHLFPTIDHSILKYLYPILWETCDKFKVTFHTEGSVEMATAELQALARNKPNAIPPS